MKFTEQSGRKSHNKENKTSVCSINSQFCYPTKLMNLFGGSSFGMPKYKHEYKYKRNLQLLVILNYWYQVQNL